MADAADVRGAFSAAGQGFVSLVEGLEPADYVARGTEEWSVLELVAHTSRAYLATEAVVAAPVDPSSRRLDSAAAYFRAALSVEGVHGGISQRAREAAESMRGDPVGFVRAAAARVGDLVARTPDDREVQHFCGRLRFGDYLTTRVMELVLHSVDLQLALGREPAVDAGAAGVVASVLLELAARADPLAVACALAGRALPAGCDVLG